MFFCSVRLTVYTLVLLATTSIIGTIVLQNGPPHQYVKLYGTGFYNLIKVLNLDDMYHAWWFLFLLLLLCINIIVCSIERLSLTWKTIFPEKVRFNRDRFRSLKNREIFTTDKEFDLLSNECRGILSKKVGRVLYEETEKGCVLYAEKGRWTRLGVYVVHASILLLVVGALIGAMFGFKANLRLDEGARADTVFTTRTRMPVKLPFSIQCNEFEVRFYDTGAPEEFRSNLTIIENGQESFTKDIRVNHPLRYKGINIFQASYGTIAPDNALFEIVDNATQKSITKKLKIGEQVTLPGDAGIFKFEGFGPNFKFRGHNLGGTFFGKVTLKEQKGFQVALPTKFPTFDKMRKGEFSFIVKKFDQRYYTGLQVTKDPGIWFVYTGFILMILGCWITFFISHQSYFIEMEKSDQNVTSVLVSGKANRNNYGMMFKIKKIVTILKDK
ncbi:MAG: cytochrome c biogenesis protein ResB [Desulfobacteraceae bacterium]|nr:cytochrome c biogenesis protein ResB [Desulfobacteraceae bacterium]